MITTKGFKVIRENEKQVVIGLPDNNFEYVNRTSFTCLEDYILSNFDFFKVSSGKWVLDTYDSSKNHVYLYDLIGNEMLFKGIGQY